MSSQTVDYGADSTSDADQESKVDAEQDSSSAGVAIAIKMLKFYKSEAPLVIPAFVLLSNGMMHLFVIPRLILFFMHILQEKFLLYFLAAAALFQPAASMECKPSRSMAFSRAPS